MPARADPSFWNERIFSSASVASSVSSYATFMRSLRSYAETSAPWASSASYAC